MTRHNNRHPLDQALQNLPDEVNPQVRLNVVWRAYEAATGDIVGDSPTDEQRQKVHEWLRLERGHWESAPPPSLLTSRRRFALPVAEDIPSKVNHLTQFLCNACEPIVNDDGKIPMILNMPVKVPPWSAQSAGTRNTLLVREIREQLQKRNWREPWGGSPICLNIAAVVPRSPRYVKDVDNLVKGLLDALAGVLYVNDQQVQCLTTRRFEYAGDVGWYDIGARAVYPWDVDVIYDDPIPPHFASGEIILPGPAASE